MLMTSRSGEPGDAGDMAGDARRPTEGELPPGDTDTDTGEAEGEATRRRALSGVKIRGVVYLPKGAAMTYTGHSGKWLAAHARKYHMPHDKPDRVYYRRDDLDTLLRVTAEAADPLWAVTRWGQYLSVPQVARLVGMHRAWVLTLIKERGAFNALAPLTDAQREAGQEDDVPPVLHIENEWRVHLRAVESFLGRHRHPPHPPPTV